MQRIPLIRVWTWQQHNVEGSEIHSVRRFLLKPKLCYLKSFCKILIVNRTEQEVGWPAAAKSSLKAIVFRLTVEWSVSWFQPTATTQNSVQKYTWRISAAVEHLSPLPHFCIFLFPQTLQRPLSPLQNAFRQTCKHFLFYQEKKTTLHPQTVKGQSLKKNSGRQVIN